MGENYRVCPEGAHYGTDNDEIEECPDHGLILVDPDEVVMPEMPG